MSDVHERFRRWFESLDTSQAKLAGRLDVSQVRVSKVLGGGFPGIEMAVAIETESDGWEDGPITVPEWAAARRKARLESESTPQP